MSGIVIQKNGFTIDNISVSLPNLNLGGLLSITTPTLVFNQVTYSTSGSGNGGPSLTGTLTFSAGSAAVNLGQAFTATITSGNAGPALSGTYDLATGEFHISLDTLDLIVGGFITGHASGITVNYLPGTDGSSQMTVGAVGVTLFLGAGSGTNQVGVQVSNGTFGLALFKSANSATSYALSASGNVSLVGIPRTYIDRPCPITGELYWRRGESNHYSWQRCECN